MVDEKEVLYEIDNRPRQEISAYLQVVGEMEPTDPLLNAHRQVHYALRESRGHNPGDPFNCIYECLHVAEVFDLYGSKDGADKVVILSLPSTNPPGTQGDAILGLLIQLHLRGWKGEVFSELTLPDEQNRSFNLKIGVKVTSDGPLQPMLWNGAVKGYKEILNLPLDTVEEFERYWQLSDRFTTALTDVQAAVELVGDLSEGLDYISYNEEGIRAAWVEGRLNSEVQWDKENDPAKYQRFIDLIGDGAPADDDYDALLTARIAKINGWPKNCYTDPYGLDALTIQEQLKILSQQLDIRGSRQQALNHHCNLRAELEKRLPSN